jgi:hypothetical protein
MGDRPYSRPPGYHQFYSLDYAATGGDRSRHGAFGAGDRLLPRPIMLND